MTLAEAGTLSYALPVVGGTSPLCFVNNLRTVTAVLPKGERGEITCELRLKNFLLCAGAQIPAAGQGGLATLDGNTIAECELTASFDIPRQREKTILGNGLPAFLQDLNFLFKGCDKIEPRGKT